MKRWISVVGMGVMGMGMLALHMGQASAHVTGAGTSYDACSPHGAGGSSAGSVFTSCSYGNYPEIGLDHYWERYISCAKGTTCANVLCGSGKQVTWGDSAYWNWPSSSHGKNGGHTPDYVGSVTCK